MTPIKPMFILYLIISSFTLSICSTSVTTKEDILSTIPNWAWKKIKEHTPEILSTAIYYSSWYGAIERLISIVGKGIANAAWGLYNALLETCGPAITGVFVATTALVVITGTVIIIYKIYKTSYVKVGEFEYCSSDSETCSERKKK